MTRIALIAGTYLPERCSVADYTMHLCANLREYGVESSVLTSYYAAEAAYDPNAIGIVHGWRLADLFTLVRAVLASKAEVLHIQYTAKLYGFEPAILLLPMLLRMAGWRSPIVTTLHECEWQEWQPKNIFPPVEWLKQRKKFPLWGGEDGFLLTHSDVVIATNTDTKKVLHNRLPQKKNSVFHIPIAANVEVASIDHTTARQLLRENCNWCKDSVVIVCFGFLHPGKGLETLLPAFKQVYLTQPQARLLILGGFESLGLSGEDAKKYLVQLQALVNELDLAQLVHFTDYVNAQSASHYLTGADIGVLPCDRPLTLNSSSLLTLLAHGLPVVATQSQTLPIGHPVRLIPPSDIAALASQLQQLLNNPDQRSELGKAGIVFGQNFTWHNIIREHLDIYSYLASKPLLK